jgi:hypothetical protein
MTNEPEAPDEAREAQRRWTHMAEVWTNNGPWISYQDRRDASWAYRFGLAAGAQWRAEHPVTILVEQVEAAAKALHDSRYGRGTWDQMTSHQDYASNADAADVYRDEVRTVLRAIGLPVADWSTL